MTSSRMRGGVLCAAVMLVLVIGSTAAAGPAVVRGPWTLVTLPALGR